jgi:aminoglycoside 3-N-acetyltransferase
MKNLIKQIGGQFKLCGLQEGSVVLVHASLKSISHITLHPELVIGGLLNAIGDSGTLLMPALSYASVNKENPYFDLERTPSNVGATAEFFRKLPGVIRSIHPTHSVCGIGKYSKEMLGTHHLDHSPAGANSPFRKLPEYGGKILFIGCGLKPNTSMHAVEELVEPAYLFGESVDFHLQLPTGKSFSKLIKTHHFKGFEQRYDRISELLTPHEMKETRVMSATVYLVDARAMWEKSTRKLQEDPYFFVDRLFAEPALARP